MNIFKGMTGLLIISVAVAVFWLAMIAREHGIQAKIALEKQREELRLQRKAEREKDFAEHPGANSRVDRSIRALDHFLTGVPKP